MIDGRRQIAAKNVRTGSPRHLGPSDTVDMPRPKNKDIPTDRQAP